MKTTLITITLSIMTITTMPSYAGGHHHHRHGHHSHHDNHHHNRHRNRSHRGAYLIGGIVLGSLLNQASQRHYNRPQTVNQTVNRTVYRDTVTRERVYRSNPNSNGEQILLQDQSGACFVVTYRDGTELRKQIQDEICE